MRIEFCLEDFNGVQVFKMSEKKPVHNKAKYDEMLKHVCIGVPQVTVIVCETV